MKRYILACLFSSLLVASSYADSLFRSASTQSIVVTNVASAVMEYRFTNLSVNAISLSGVDLAWQRANVGTLSVSRVRGSITNVLLTQAYSAASSFVATKGTFDGLWFIQNDIIRIWNFMDGANTNTLIPNLEEAR